MKLGFNRCRVSTWSIVGMPLRMPLLGMAVVLCGCSPQGEPTSQLDDATDEPPSRLVSTTAGEPQDGTNTQGASKRTSEKDQPQTPRKLSVSKQFNKLDEMERYVILRKGTERAFTGEYWDHKGKGTYICRRCNAALYKSDSKFDSHCGWPSFDDEIKGAVLRQPDADGFRIEIVCNNCGGHLGHVFLGERFTAKNTRHCVNSVSIRFVEEGEKLPDKIVPDDLKEQAAKGDAPAAKQDETKPPKTDK